MAVEATTRLERLERKPGGDLRSQTDALSVLPRDGSLTRRGAPRTLAWVCSIEVLGNENGMLMASVSGTAVVV